MSALLCVGTAGMSVWFSRDLGETWTRPYIESGLYLEARVWALSAHPQRPGEVLAGTDSGVYRWRERDKRWTHLPSPLDDLDVWALVQAPDDPDLLIAGTQPAGFYRSTDGGATWTKALSTTAESCIFVGKPRVTQILFDPVDRDTLWAGVEIDGVHRSTDRGKTWTKVGKGLTSDDIHGVAVVRDGGKLVYATTNKGLHVSADNGANWEFQPLDSPWQYTRTVVPRADDDATVFLTNGNGPPGSTGRLLRSRDHGKHWDDAGLPGELNSTPWTIATHPSDPKLMFVCSNLGQIFRSTDGGESWTRLKREFGEVRSTVWQPLA
ncbi:MAG: hypothetical protein IPK81_12055 [Rhodospirillales bacterium]|nr:MAG: hypothetical protein IPK81_12055 [Rhodospirillales bacterium]